MKTITINPHNCSREEYQELLDYLEEFAWDYSIEKEEKLATSKEDMRDYLKKLILSYNGSDKIQLDNLDWARLVNDEGEVKVENEHGTVFDIDDLSDQELEIFWINN